MTSGQQVSPERTGKRKEIEGDNTETFIKSEPDLEKGTKRGPGRPPKQKQGTDSEDANQSGTCTAYNCLLFANLWVCFI